MQFSTGNFSRQWLYTERVYNLAKQKQSRTEGGSSGWKHLGMKRTDEAQNNMLLIHYSEKKMAERNGICS